MLPWLLGFAPDAVADHPTRAVAAEVSEWKAPDDRCVASAYGGLALDRGQTRVIASYSQGVFVLGKDRHLLARAPGLPCAGSADELVGLETGEAWVGAPLIALAATTGGRAESVTQLMLYRVGDNGVLEPVFTGAVERHADHQTHTGTVTVVPGGLIYRAPEGTTSIWIYDGRHYVEHGSFPQT
jgi:hypothetical protein